jgi:methylglutaconyl-CoA hydratase
MVHGAAIGGGAGLAACADLVIAAETAHFCFSEVKLGLIPAVISPYVIKAIGERNALALFMTAENFDAHQAKTLQLVHEVVTPETLLPRTAALAQQLAATAPLALKACKALVRQIANHPLDETLMTHTAQVIANKRVSQEGQRGIQAFLSKIPPIWD